ncbi:MAG: histidine phosphatase family protein [Candidatus Aenigmarchaeota archaeon]|nr:histidine phosphatase family protein [Candidatus Aenigmarchaeota archaeon]
MLFVAHGSINKAIIRVIMNKDLMDLSIVEQKNTAVSIFEIDKDRNHKIHLLNCTKHLE